MVSDDGVGCGGLMGVGCGGLMGVGAEFFVLYKQAKVPYFLFPRKSYFFRIYEEYRMNE